MTALILCPTVLVEQNVHARNQARPGAGFRHVRRMGRWTHALLRGRPTPFGERPGMVSLSSPCSRLFPPARLVLGVAQGKRPARCSAYGHGENHLGARRGVLHLRATPEVDLRGGAEGLHLAPLGRDPATPLMTLVTRRQTHRLLLRSTGFFGTMYYRVMLLCGVAWTLLCV